MSDHFSAEVPEADALEQNRNAGFDDEPASEDILSTSSEADTADALEQSITVELDDDDASSVETYRD
ncbi:hypothetical protein [Leucobacter manosquensis]|uniref:Multidrug transporter n=1 Tax=Leucobacter manosquensis TaxID=2810611 RepID=A0ABS5M6I0_9MICO|nr:hypothetical protein [Leucobacter manosquensis]MBS3182762.1 hypothetical protein [Leucobacter manosquensis]